MHSTEAVVERAVFQRVCVILEIKSEELKMKNGRLASTSFPSSPMGMHMGVGG